MENRRGLGLGKNICPSPVTALCGMDGLRAVAEAHVADHGLLVFQGFVVFWKELLHGGLRNLLDCLVTGGYLWNFF